MLDIDFIAGSKSDPESTSSYDAIAIRFKAEDDPEQKVIVIDAGFADIGNDVVNHLAVHYDTDKVDLMISTHPDNDHLNGLITAIQQLDVTELMIHQPDKYKDDLSQFTNLENLNTLVAFAVEQGVTITDPYAGQHRFDGRICILGPTEGYYKTLLDQQLDPAVTAEFARRSNPAGLAAVLASLEGLVERTLDALPFETLSDDVKTHPRNSTSVITLLDFNGKKYLFTGDAGIEALHLAADEYEKLYGSFANNPLAFFQAPHHGSRRNVGPEILNRILGDKHAAYNENLHGFVHAAKASKKHPSPKVTNALMRRGVKQSSLAVTNGQTKWHHSHASVRDGWSNIAPYPVLKEDDES
ncbi:MAG: MBL fold metallo-hydrolase [Patescibacteria group bacterium]